MERADAGRCHGRWSSLAKGYQPASRALWAGRRPHRLERAAGRVPARRGRPPRQRAPSGVHCAAEGLRLQRSRPVACPASSTTCSERVIIVAVKAVVVAHRLGQSPAPRHPLKHPRFVSAAPVRLGPGQRRGAGYSTPPAARRPRSLRRRSGLRPSLCVSPGPGLRLCRPGLGSLAGQPLHGKAHHPTKPGVCVLFRSKAFQLVAVRLGIVRSPLAPSPPARPLLADPGTVLVLPSCLRFRCRCPGARPAPDQVAAAVPPQPPPLSPRVLSWPRNSQHREPAAAASVPHAPAPPAQRVAARVHDAPRFAAARSVAGGEVARCSVHHERGRPGSAPLALARGTTTAAAACQRTPKHPALGVLLGSGHALKRDGRRPAKQHEHGADESKRKRQRRQAHHA
mmetsp:Transcript_14038/g.53327  ORF Transcript_14038/g.53327 Transcript_14038/m.53327 type:complete len:398 (+) Transcript_14038:698-1891(+)